MQNCLNIAKSFILSCQSKINNTKWISPCSFWIIIYKHLKPSRVFLTGHTQSDKGNPLCQKHDNVSTNNCAVLIPWLQHLQIKSGYDGPSCSKSWKLLWATLTTTYEPLAHLITTFIHKSAGLNLSIITLNSKKCLTKKQVPFNSKWL